MHKLFMSSGAHRESDLSKLRSAEEKCCSNLKAPQTAVFLGLTDNTLIFSSIFYPQKASRGADASMNFSGKLPNVLLLVLLAAQGKTDRESRCCAGCTKCSLLYLIQESGECFVTLQDALLLSYLPPPVT